MRQVDEGSLYLPTFSGGVQTGVRTYVQCTVNSYTFTVYEHW